jgi:hypothetical protein
MKTVGRDTLKRAIKRILPSRAVSFRRRIATYTKNRPRISFGYAGEDLLINQLLPPDIDFKTMRYLDIGCENPIIANNTYYFYRKGARGICVDARKELRFMYKIFRPKDLFLSYIVTDSETHSGVVDFYVNPDDPHISSVDRGWAKGNLPKEIQPRQVQVVSLSEIIKSNFSFFGENSTRFTILSIDTESHDLNVLRSNDWKSFQPNVICVESHIDGNISKYLTSEIHLFLEGYEYFLASTNSLSAIYKKK